MAAPPCFEKCLNDAAARQGCKDRLSECFCSDRLAQTDFGPDVTACSKETNCTFTPQQLLAYLEGLCGGSTSRTSTRDSSSTSPISSTGGPASAATIIAAIGALETTTSNTAAIAGGVVAAVVVLAAIIVIFFIRHRRRHRRRDPSQLPEKDGRYMHVAPPPAWNAYERLPAPAPPPPQNIQPMTEAKHAELRHLKTIALWQHQRNQSVSSDASVYSGVRAAVSEYSFSTTRSGPGSVSSHAPSRSGGRDGRSHGHRHGGSSSDTTRPLLHRNETWEVIPVTPTNRNDPSFLSFSIDSGDEEGSHQDPRTRRKGSASSSASSHIEPYTYRPVQLRQLSDSAVLGKPHGRVRHAAPPRRQESATATTSHQIEPYPSRRPPPRQASDSAVLDTKRSATHTASRDHRRAGPSASTSTGHKSNSSSGRNPAARVRRNDRILDSIDYSMTPPPLYNLRTSDARVSFGGHHNQGPSL